MTIAVASGKGGTGKTTISVSLALADPGPVTLLDCDVEEPNAGIFLKQNSPVERPVTVLVPEIDKSLCNACGKCGSFCEFNAIVCIGTSVMVFPELCHSCGGCALVCPQKAIREVPVEIGTLIESTVSRPGPGKSIFPSMRFIQGLLKIGNAMSPPVIRAVKNCGSGSGSAKDDLIIIDSPPGTSCPMVTSVTGADYVILVTEPTPFGLHDLNLAVKTIQKMGITFGVIINRSDSGDDRVVTYCGRENIRILLLIPEDRRIAEGYSNGLPLIAAAEEYRIKFSTLAAELLSRAKSAEADMGSITK